MTKTVKVVYTTQHDKQGNAKLISARPIVQKVKHHYLDGRVCTSTGDVWHVIKNDNPKEATYLTVKPPRKD